MNTFDDNEINSSIGLEIMIQFPKFNYSEVKRLWYVDYYDGPLSGIMDYHGKLYWYEMIDEINAPYYPIKPDPKDDRPHWTICCGRLFAVVELNSEQLEYEIESHKLFEENKKDYDEEDNGLKKPFVDGETYFRSTSKVVGWFIARRSIIE
jgi:hypothetical protein